MNITLNEIVKYIQSKIMNCDHYWIRVGGIDFNLADVILVTLNKDSYNRLSATITLKGNINIEISTHDYPAFDERWTKYMQVMTRRWVDTTAVEWDKVDQPDELQRIANADKLRNGLGGAGPDDGVGGVSDD